MASKSYRFEVSVSRGWSGVEEIRIAVGTDNEDELKDLVNKAAAAMQDRADWHQKQRQIADEITQKMLAKQQALNDEQEAQEQVEETN